MADAEGKTVVSWKEGEKKERVGEKGETIVLGKTRVCQRVRPAGKSCKSSMGIV